MDRTEPRYWFLAKRYGWGWGFPVTWEGWLVLGSWFALVLLGARHILPESPVLFFGLLAGLSAILVAICYKKGEPPGWRWS